MNNVPEERPVSPRQVELDIFGAVSKHWKIDRPRGRATDAQKWLDDKYKSKRQREQVIDTINFLVDEKCLSPVRGNGGIPLKGSAGNITSKGDDRYRRLRSPRAIVWIKDNSNTIVIGIVVASIAAGIVRFVFGE